MSAYQDLLKDSSKVDPGDKNYFIVTITDLDVNNTYPLQFRWKREGGAFSVWSSTKIITTPGESVPGEPSLPAGSVTGEPGLIRVIWNGTDAAGKTISNIDRVDIYVDGGTFDGTKPTSSFKSAGTQTIAAASGEYFVTLYSVTSYGKKSAVSSARSVVVPGIGTTVSAPQDPSAPTIEAGLASIIVTWDGKKANTENFTTGSFAGAKVYIGTSADFVPSNNNWVHSLNFANGTNQVAIGVGTVIDKALGTKLEYGVPYYVKIKTVNAAVPPVETATAVASSPTNITIDKVAASEIVTGTLAADASITAGIVGGSRVVLSGGASPLVIYGTNGTTELLKFTGGATGTLTVNGGGTFTGDLSAGSGSSIFKSDSSGIYLGNSAFASAPFSVSRNGILKAEAGTIGGWTLGGTYFQNALTSPTIKIDTTGIIVGATSSAYIDITSSGITHRNSNGVASGKFTLSTGASASLTINGTFTIDGSSTIDGTAASTVKSGAASGASALQDGNGITKNGSNQISTILMNNAGISISTAAGGTRLELNNSGLKLWNGSTNTVNLDGTTGNAEFKGVVKADSGYVGGWNISTSGFISNPGATTFLYPTLGTFAFVTDRSISVDKFIQTGNAGHAIQGGSGNFMISQAGIAPGSVSFSSNPSATDQAWDLGYSSARWGTVRAGSFLTTSDYRVKNNIENTPLGLDFINKLRPVAFKYNLGKNLPVRNENNEIVSFQEYPGTRTHHGFIAQEVKLALNEITSNSSTDFAAWKMDDVSDPESQQALDYLEFIAPITKAIQELSARLDALEG